MRDEFRAIISGWCEDDLAAITVRIGALDKWLARNGASNADCDEQLALTLMVKRQILLAIRAGAYEPFVRADIDDEKIQAIVEGPEPR
jgi:hypothetical protein